MANIKSINGNPIVVGASGIEGGVVTDAKLAQTGGVLETVRTLNRSVFAERTSSGSVIGMRNCIGITSVSNTGDELTCVGGENILPAPTASSQSHNGVTITTNGSGTYIITRTAEATGGANIRFQLPEPVFVPAGVDVYVHQMASAFSNNAVLNLFDDSSARIYSKSIVSGNAIEERSSSIGGKRIGYVGFYLAADFTGTITLSPMIMFTQAQSEYIEFGGISTATGAIPSVPDGNLSYIWANTTTATPINVTYITRDGGLVDDIAKLETLGSKKQANGTIAWLDHPGYIDGIYASASGDAYTGGVVAVGGENLLPPVSERSVSSGGVTINSNGSGGYTLSGTATDGGIVFLPLEVPITFPDSSDAVIYLHLRNDAINVNTSINFADESRVQVSGGWLPSPINRIVDISSFVKGKTIAYLVIYHSASASYATPLHVRPTVTPSSEVSGSEVFEGVLTDAGDAIESVPSSTSCYVWAEDGTDLSISYTAGIGYVETKIEGLQDSIISMSDTDVVLRNKDVLPWVYASSNYGINGSRAKNYKKMLSMLVLTDVHGSVKQVSNWVEYLNGIDSIDCGINLGDTTASYYSDNDGSWYTDIVNTSEKPVFTVLGNHDVWTPTLDASIAPTEDMAFQKWIEPTLGVMGVSTSKPYYMKNFDEYGVSLICLNTYGIPNNTVVDGSYKTRRDLDAWTQAHVDWFVSALQSVPSGYHLIVAAHDFPSGNTSVSVQQCAWTRVLPSAGVVAGNGSPNMGTLLQDVVNAWVNGASITKTYELTPYPSLYDVDDFSALTVDADFSTRGMGIFVSFILGHGHSDTYAKVTAYEGLNVLTFASSANDNYQNANTDLPRIEGTKLEDCITVLSVDTTHQLVKLVRVGSNKTINMTDRTVFEYGY